MYDPQPARLFHRHPFRRIHLRMLISDHKCDEPREKERQQRSLPEQSAPLPPALFQQGHPLPVDLLARPDHVVLPQSSTLRNAHGAASTSTRSGWKSLLGHPVVKLIVGLVVGIGLLLFVANLVNLPKALHIIQSQLGTPRGLFSGFMASVTYFMAFIFRALRWKLFLQRVGKIKTLRVIQLFMAGVFLNFLVPIRIGEVAKSLILKRVANMPIGQSFSTITIDKVFDLLPALFIVALVPLFHVSLDGRFWVVLSLANGALLGMVLFVLISAWKRSLAFSILHSLLKPFPSSLGDKVEGFATGFVETLLASAR
ncbi:MAG TPA: lysylphosphatidylglycerol synthase transmembrane domain-containing protein, partial [Ktedonobacteraceae bacterium]